MQVGNTQGQRTARSQCGDNSAARVLLATMPPFCRAYEFQPILHNLHNNLPCWLQCMHAPCTNLSSL